ncbi:MAG: hypothetical protein JW712_14740 [Dehalococcoidales bacterium]|nr:hypothetical protein [Dehalococcoidales bacterium]
MKAENRETGWLQKDSAEHEEYAGAQSADSQEVGEQDGADLLERILSRENLNSAYKRVKENHGAPGIDGMTIEEALPWLKEHKEELLESIRQGKYKPQPVRRKEIPKLDGGIRKLGIPTVVDRIIQEAIVQQLNPIYEPKFSDGSYGYRPKRSARQAIEKVKEYAEQGHTTAVQVDLTEYFDILNHELLMNLGMSEWQAYRNGNTHKGYWTIAGSGILQQTITNKGLVQAGYYSILDRYESLHLSG